MPFPVTRPRRLRKTEYLRKMVRETKLSPENLVLPLFVVEGLSGREPVRSMPGVERLSIEEAVAEAKEAETLGIGGVILFGIPQEKDEIASGAYDDKGVVQEATRAIKAATSDKIVTIADTCLCEYTSHGHCGIIKDNDVENDKTLELLARTAVSQSNAGADMIAPSDMMDGRVGKIREALDKNGKTETLILSYAAKYNSAFYGPFRDAAESAPSFGDRSSYQMDPANAREAIKEVLLDIEEGADLVMVKPALAYLDIILAVRSEVEVPVAAYFVSGEYAMIKAAAANGWLDETRSMMEAHLAIRRAGADLILTYWAKEAAKKLS